MKFCSRCGTVLVLDREEGCLVCPRCGANQPMERSVVYSRDPSQEEKIIVIGKEERDLRTLPETRVECPKCGNNRAYWWMVQTRSADESATQFYRCTKCGHTWREYS